MSCRAPVFGACAGGAVSGGFTTPKMLSSDTVAVLTPSLGVAECLAGTPSEPQSPCAHTVNAAAWDVAGVARRNVHLRTSPVVSMAMLDSKVGSEDGFTTGALYSVMERSVTPSGLQRIASVPTIEATVLKPMAYHCSTPFTALAPVILKSMKST